MLVVATMIAGPLGTPAALAQETDDEVQTPDTVAPGSGDSTDDATPAAADEDEATTPDATEETDESSVEVDEGEFALDATGSGSPAVIGQGLAFLTGERVVWQVREIEPDPAGEAASATATTAVVYQVEGETIIRNDITGKRVLLEPGEAFFLSGGDPYTNIANTSNSLMWSFEVVGDNLVDDDAFYESPLIEDYDEGVYDLEMIRFVLAPGDQADIPEHTGPALIMSLDGDVDIETNGIGLLGTGDGQLVAEPGTVSNNSNEPVVYAVIAFGAEVSDDSAGSSSTAPTPAVADDDGGDDDAAATDDTADEAASDEAANDEGSSEEGAGSSEFRTSLNITALSELYVVVVVDGVTAFDGPIPEGGQSGAIVGSVFEVYTTWGAMTQFTNACGETFNMGFEEGEVTYYLEATADSCPPE
jgi:hypothetical protein